MSKIQRELDTLKSYGATINVDTIIDNFNMKDVKEYITYLQKENARKGAQIYDLIVENTKMQIKLELKKR
ncbi:hypothetical protein [Bacillus thuringiensis]|uniref:hypothetical protein n=1 Tax=Bacillus thuringiensis TaxID=1428 RepID=UPI000BF3DDBE|nr:hypothetical protein [Bacillus thuringiensis]PFC28507.1 hypothetical protein CN299_19750 [Bacillus thuringiensis]